MIPPHVLALYCASAALLVISPGPDFLYVVTRGIAQGRRAGLLSAVGISVGLMCHTTFAALGLSAVLQSSEQAFAAIKYAGAAYLLYLGMRTLVSRSAPLPLTADPTAPRVSAFAIFRQGVITNVLNPKAILTFMAFIPQFISTSSTNASAQIVLLGAILALLAIGWFSGVGYFAGAVGGFLSRRTWYRHATRWVMGSMFVALGIRLAFQHRD